MDHKITEQIKQWLDAREAERDYTISALYLLKLSGNQIMYRNIFSQIDHKATNKTLKLWAFITQVIERTYLADNHSKILLVRSEKGDTVSVITSQNLTRGNRYESAFISTDPAIFDRLHEQVNDLITNHSVPLHDLFRQRLAAD